MVFGCGGDWLNFLTSHQSFGFSSASTKNKWVLKTPLIKPLNWYLWVCVAAERRRMAFQTSVLPMLSCKLLTLELICEQSSAAFGRGWNSTTWFSYLHKAQSGPYTQRPMQKQTQTPLWMHTSAVYLKIVCYTAALIQYLARCTL